MSTRETHYVPALGLHILTPLYDPLVAITTRERRFKQFLIALAGVREGERVLDLGCGTGTLAIRMQQAVPGASVTGLDADPEILELARDKALHAGVKIRFDEGLATGLPYAGASHDKVVPSLFFHHLQLDDKLATLREVYRVLVLGGELFVADFGKPNALLRVLFYAVQVLDGFESTPDNVEGRLPELFQEAGFERVAIRGQVNTMLGTIALYSAAKPA